MAGGDEVPAARLLAEVQVPAEDRAAAVEALDRVLDVHVVDAVGELGHERGAVEELVLEVRRVEVDPEALAVVERVQRLARGDEVVGDLGRVDLERELHALGVEDVDDRDEALGELLVAALDLREVVGREASRARCQIGEPVKPVTVVTPSRAAARAVSLSFSAARWRTPSGSPSPHTSGGTHALVAAVDRVADRLADEVVADRPDLEVVARRAARAARVQ